jgi:hypothetical protein
MSAAAVKPAVSIRLATTGTLAAPVVVAMGR